MSFEIVHAIAGAIYAQVYDKFNKTKPEYSSFDDGHGEVIRIEWFIPHTYPSSCGIIHTDRIAIELYDGYAVLVAPGQQAQFEYANQEFPQNLYDSLKSITVI